MNTLRSILEDAYDFAVDIAPLFIVIFVVVVCMVGLVGGFFLLGRWLAG